MVKREAEKEEFGNGGCLKPFQKPTLFVTKN